MYSNKRIQTGFTLVEIAIVLLVVSILLGYTVAMFPAQQNLKKYRQVDREMDEIVEHLIGFAQVNGRLPCPDTSNGTGTIDGLEDQNAGTNGCEAFFGFLPGRTLGVQGVYDAAGSLLDPWGSGYGYAVSDILDGTGTDRLLVTTNGIRAEGMTNVTPDLFVCSDSNAVGMDADCSTVSGADVAANIPAVVISMGRDAELPATSNIQEENTDDFHDGTTDKVYISASQRDDYDDEVRWISINLLFSRMIAAEQLP